MGPGGHCRGEMILLAKDCCIHRALVWSGIYHFSAGELADKASQSAEVDRQTEGTSLEETSEVCSKETDDKQ